MTYTISPQNEKLEVDIQKKINICLDDFTSFCFDAGAGAGKTYALQKSIEYVLKTSGDGLKLRNQKILCITYTNTAKDEILNRLGKNSSVLISTIHEFLWNFISIQQDLLIVEHKKKVSYELDEIEKKINKNPLTDSIKHDEFQENCCDEEFLKVFYKYYSESASDFKSAIKNYNVFFEQYLSNVSNFKELVKKMNEKCKFEITLKEIEDKKSKKINYNPIKNRDKLENYVISHDTLLVYCKNIITNQNLLKRLFSDRYPYVLIDEYQDTDGNVINIIDSIMEYSKSKKDFVIGFFGDTLQNIYGSGVGILPNKGAYNTIEKTFNRRSSDQIVKLIERIRNDNFGQESIYADFNNGSSYFYVANADFDLDDFLQRKNLISNTACLLMKNDDISKARGFDTLLSNLRKFPRFSGNNYDNITNEFLQKNKQHVGWFLRDILTFIDFIQKSVDNSSTVKEIIQFTTFSKSLVTFGEMKNFIDKIREIRPSSLTIDKCINSVASITGQISGENIINKIFSTNSTSECILLNIKNRAYDYFYYSQDSQENLERDLTTINDFFGLEVSQFIKWYDYIFDNLSHENISYYTLHGSKGLEFDNVVVVLQDDFARKRDYCRYFFENYNSLVEDVGRFNEVRNLLYVACSRAKINLHVIYKTDTLEDIPENMLENIKSIFERIHDLT